MSSTVSSSQSKLTSTAMGESQRASSSSLHIVVFPWLAFGHLIPFMELSKRLAARGHAVTFVSTPRNAARLGAVPLELSVRVRVVTLDLPAVDGLPDGAESTADVPPEKVELLKTAFDGLAVPFQSLLVDGDATGGEFSRKPDWIILDFAHHWVMPIADEHKIACAMFLIFPVALLAYLGPKHENEAHPRSTTEDYMAQPPWVPFPSNLRFRRHEAAANVHGFRPNASGVSDIHRLLLQLHHPSCRLIVHRSCPEAEPRLFPLVADLFAPKPVVPAGLLMPGGDDGVLAAAPAPEDDAGESVEVPLMRWLDEQPRRSVVYVALGSEAPVTAAQVRELALGLELSGARFLWALRPPSGETGDDRSGSLPGGFERRVAGRGVVRAGWVPQVRVLAHAAVGAFLTHCGWGSTVEGLFRFGRPLVMLPFVGDQGLIAREVAARGAGVEVRRDDDDGGSFRADDVAAAVRRVMGMTAEDEEGVALSRNAAEMQKAVGDRVRQEQYLDDLVDYLQRYK